MDKESKEKEFQKVHDSLHKMRRGLHTTADAMNNLLRKIFGVPTNEVASFGSTYWTLNKGNKKIYLKLHANGEIVYDFQTKLTIEQKTSLDTRVDFLEPNLKPNVSNTIDLVKHDGMENLFQKMTKHFSEIPATQ